LNFIDSTHGTNNESRPLLNLVGKDSTVMAKFLPWGPARKRCVVKKQTKKPGMGTPGNRKHYVQTVGTHKWGSTGRHLDIELLGLVYWYQVPGTVRMDWKY
jgi:hypothetical protein